MVGDDYLPIWKVPSLGHYHNELKLGHRESLNAYLRSKGEQPSGWVWWPVSVVVFYSRPGGTDPMFVRALCVAVETSSDVKTPGGREMKC